MRYRITVRGLGIDLRGFMDRITDEGAPTLADLAEALKPFGVVVASEGGENFEPFREWTQYDQDRLAEATREAAHWKQQASNLQDIVDSTFDPDDVPRIRRLIMQRREIKTAWKSSERYQGLWRKAVDELRGRELHHFEVEQENERLKAEERCDFDCDKCRED